jgi:hypothetical protein
MTYKYKTSYGIALCRYNASKNNQPEILLIKKRYTYCYFSFVFGHYKKYNNKHLQYLFNNMSFGEKVDVFKYEVQQYVVSSLVIRPREKPYG